MKNKSSHVISPVSFILCHFARDEGCACLLGCWYLRPLTYPFTCPPDIASLPQGIPVLLPGEAITEEALRALRAVKQGGGMISGCTDTTLSTMRVVDRLVPTGTA